jgi:hypothetical protein
MYRHLQLAVVLLERSPDRLWTALHTIVWCARLSQEAPREIFVTLVLALRGIVQCYR